MLISSQSQVTTKCCHFSYWLTLSRLALIGDCVTIRVHVNIESMPFCPAYSVSSCRKHFSLVNALVNSPYGGCVVGNISTAVTSKHSTHSAFLCKHLV